MTAIQTVAIDKLVAEKAAKEARKQVGPGTYTTDFWLHIAGGMEIGEDYIRKIPQRARPWNLLAVALSHLNGVTVQSLVREAMAADAEQVKDIKARAESAVVSIKGMTESICSGRIKADLKAEVVENAMTIPRAA